MTPMLILLTGPAVGEVANPDTPEPILPGFTVRDYDSVCIKLIDCLTNDCDNYVWLEERIRALPGGEEWLVGLVLPDTPDFCAHECGEEDEGGPLWGCPRCRDIAWLPDAPLARLAILAPDPPPLLVERVRAWGGEVWWCADDPDADQGICFIGRVAGSPAPAPACPASMTCAGRADTWLEAVRAALGEP